MNRDGAIAELSGLISALADRAESHFPNIETLRSWFSGALERFPLRISTRRKPNVTAAHAVRTVLLLSAALTKREIRDVLGTDRLFGVTLSSRVVHNAVYPMVLKGWVERLESGTEVRFAFTERGRRVVTSEPNVYLRYLDDMAMIHGTLEEMVARGQVRRVSKNGEPAYDLVSK